jgi:bacterioferritin
MQGDSGVISALNELLAGELTAADQYFIHARMYEDWGYQALYEKAEHERQEEIDHADWLIRRILFLGGTPDLATRQPLNVGSDVPSMLRNDLDLEYAVVEHLRRVIALCESAGDAVTRELLEKLLDDTERDHTHWLEKQLHLIDSMGLANYLQLRTHDHGGGDAEG